MKTLSKKENFGITLIALIIIIIILIILAGTSISMILGNEGLLNKAKYATENYSNAQQQEGLEIAKYKDEIDSYVDGNRNYEDEINNLKSEIQKLKNLYEYSTDEKVVGAWTDNKPIYRKVISLGNLTANNKEQYIPTGISNVKHIVNFNIRFRFDDGNEFDNLYILKYSHGYISPYIDYNSSKIYVAHACDCNLNSVIAIIEYTKTTD